MPAADAAIPWLPVWTSFLLGVASGAAGLAGLTCLFGSEDVRRPARDGFALAFALAVLGLALLGVAGVRGAPAWQRIGPNGLAALAVVAASAALCGLGADGTAAGKWLAVAGTVAAAALGATVGPLPEPEWVGPAWVASSFLVSAAATGSAAVVLVARWRSAGPDADRLTTAVGWAVVAELAVLTGLALSLRGLSGLAFQRWPGRLIPLFVVPAGLVAPLLLRQVRGPRGVADAAWLVLLGGLALRAAVAGIPASLTLR